MLKYSILFLLIFISHLVKSQNIYSALQLNQERAYKTAKPKKIIEHNTFYSSSGKEDYKNIKTFDPVGMLLIEERYDETGNLSARLTYVNDTLNRLTLSRTFERWNKLGYSNETATYKYEKKALISITDTDVRGNRIGFSEMTNNEEGYPIVLNVYNGNGQLLGKEIATYFYPLNQVATNVLNKNDQIISADTSKISFVNASKFPSNKESYNSYGDLISWVRKKYDGSEIIMEGEYVYDTLGNCKEERVYRTVVKVGKKPKRIISSVFKKEYTY